MVRTRSLKPEHCCANQSSRSPVTARSLGGAPAGPRQPRGLWMSGGGGGRRRDSLSSIGRGSFMGWEGEGAPWGRGGTNGGGVAQKSNGFNYQLQHWG